MLITAFPYCEGNPINDDHNTYREEPHPDDCDIAEKDLGLGWNQTTSAGLIVAYSRYHSYDPPAPCPADNNQSSIIS